MRVEHCGATRTVILVGNFAVKIAGAWAFARPGRFSMFWRSFLNGLLANLQEREFSRTGWSELCPVLASDPIGLVVVMPRARVMTRDEFLSFDFDGFTHPCDGYVVPAEEKWNSFGWMPDGRLVVIDYGGA